MAKVNDEFTGGEDGCKIIQQLYTFNTFKKN